MSVRSRFLILAALLAAAAPAHAGLGPIRNSRNQTWADSRGATGPRVIARYVTAPVRTATGNGGMDHPVLPAQLWDYATSAPRIPLETWTVTATDATTFSVTGSVSGVQATTATVGASYTTANGVQFTISAGGTPFVAGDKFEFAVVEHLTPSAIPGAVSTTIPGTGSTIRPTPGFSLRSENRSYDGSYVVYEAGYVALTTSSAPAALNEYPPVVRANTAFPARQLQNTSVILEAPFWDDLVQKPGSRVWTATSGRAGARVHVIEYNDFAHRADPTASYTFQVVFFENQDRVRFHYVRLQDGAGAFADGRSASIGVQSDLSDRWTANVVGTNATSVSTGLVIEFGADDDGDGLPFGLELQYGTNPVNRASDGGVLLDGAQLVAGLDPTSAADNAGVTADTDADGILDINEGVIGTNPMVADTDGDGLSDGVERNAATPTDPRVADTDGDGRSDGQEDADASGNVTATETNPRLWDTDGDGLGDGQEAALATDPLDSTSGRIRDALQLPGQGTFMSMAIDSKGFVHVAYSRANRNNISDDIRVALLAPNAGAYQIVVATTIVSPFPGNDELSPIVVTAPGAPGSAVDRTLLMTTSKNGYAQLAELDFGAAARDGSASTSEVLVKATRTIPLPVAMNRPHVKLVGDRLHVVFQGQEVISSDRFRDQPVPRGSYYLQLELDGDVVVGPIKLYESEGRAHHHHYPRVAVDGAGNIHSVVRGGTCKWSGGPSRCSLYYTKLAPSGQALIPTTRLQLEGNGGIHRGLDLAVSPNGLLNIVYTTNAPVISGNGDGGYSVGNEVRLLTLATVNDEVTVVNDQVPLFSVAPTPDLELPEVAGASTYRTPAVTIDAGGNLHVFVVEDQNARSGIYAAFNGRGERKLGPYHTESADDWGIPSIAQAGNAVLVGYSSRLGFAAVRHIDISGNTLDLTGGEMPTAPNPAGLALTQILPDAVALGGALVVTIRGNGFGASPTATIGGVALTGVSLYDEFTLVGRIDAATLAEGAHDVVVARPDGAMATLPGAFYVGVRPSIAPPAPPADDGGCCDVRGASPLGSLLLTGLVLAHLGRRRRRAAA